MTDEAKAVRRAYLAAWRKKNPERVREQNRRYWERRALKLQAGKAEVQNAEKKA